MLLAHLCYRWCLAFVVRIHSQNSGMMLSLSSLEPAPWSHLPSRKSPVPLGCHYHGIGVSHGSEAPSQDHQAGKIPGGALGHLRNCHWLLCNTWSETQRCISSFLVIQVVKLSGSQESKQTDLLSSKEFLYTSPLKNDFPNTISLQSDSAPVCILSNTRPVYLCWVIKLYLLYFWYTH